MTSLNKIRGVPDSTLLPSLDGLPGMATGTIRRRVEVPLVTEKLKNGVSEAGVIHLPQAQVQFNPREIGIEAEEAPSFAYAHNISSMIAKACVAQIPGPSVGFCHQRRGDEA